MEPMLPIEIAMSKRKNIEKKLGKCWRSYYQSVARERKKATNEYRHDIRYLLACLLNTYLDADNNIDWCGTWADHLIDEAFDFDSSGVKKASGLMVCSDRDACVMHITPFIGKFICTVDSDRPVSYQLYFAAEGPWKKEGTHSVLPSTKDKDVRQKLLDNWSKPDSHWATIYRSSKGAG